MACGISVTRKGRGVSSHLEKCEKCAKAKDQNLAPRPTLHDQLQAQLEEIKKLKTELKTLNSKFQLLEDTVRKLTTTPTTSSQNSTPYLKATSPWKVIPQTIYGRNHLPFSTNPFQPLTPKPSPQTQNPTTELIIKNVPYHKDEDLKAIINSIAKKKTLPINGLDFKSFRAINNEKAKTNPANAPKIILTLTTNQLKNDFEKKIASPITPTTLDYKFHPLTEDCKDLH